MTRPSHHLNDTKSSFTNPWPSAVFPSLTELCWSGGFPLGWARKHLHRHPKAESIKVVKPDWGSSYLSSHPKLEERKALRGTWLGHAGAFVEVPLNGLEKEKGTAKLLFDPIFSGRAGPTSYTGPGRIRESPCMVEDLPGVDCVFISHNHYDHLDLASIQAVLKFFPEAKYFVPLGNKKWFLDTGVPEHLITELDWWEDKDLCPEELGYPAEDPEGPSTTILRITCTPAQHNSGRAAMDHGSTLWAGWVFEQLVRAKPTSPGDEATARVTRKGAVFFAGDTGYRKFAKSDEVCPIFEELGKKLGPFDMSFIPIWRGGSLGFISYLGLRLAHETVPSSLHGSPSDAVDIHLDVKSRNSIGIHFGTFIGAEEETLEAVVELHETCEEKSVGPLTDEGVEKENGRMGVINLGETFVVEIADLVIV